jgi:hypothetical protein
MSAPNDSLTPFGKSVKAIGAVLLILVTIPFAIIAGWYRDARQFWRSLTLKDPNAK